MTDGVLRGPAARLLPLAQLDPSGVEGVFCDIDDTLTWKGELVPSAFAALSALRDAGLKVVPVTGRPAGWADQIARQWPVHGVVGENGGLWFYRSAGTMQRVYLQSDEERRTHRQRLDALAAHILSSVPGTALASDQPYRALDLAIDFCEDVPALQEADIDAIVRCFDEAGATCKVSSIHVNGWFGSFDKLTGCGRFLEERWGTSLDHAAKHWVFAGDSANDEPMFRHFEQSVGVANVARFLPRMKHHPRFLTEGVGGHGFSELAEHLLAARR